jgi:hypothetical protein
MSIAAALISGAFSLFGGKKNRDAQRDANAANSPEGQVAAWEAAGINPVMGITQGQWIPQQAVSMGDSFANAGNALARGMELNHEEQLAQTGLRKENEELREALSELSKRPEPSNMERFGSQLPIGDLDARIDQAYGVSPESRHLDGVSFGSGGRSPNAVTKQTLFFAPDREIERSPVQDTSLMMTVDNAVTRHLGTPLTFLGEDGDPLDIWQLAAMGLQAAPQLGYYLYKNRTDAAPYRALSAIGIRNDPIPWGAATRTSFAPPTPTLSEEFRPDLSDGWRSLFFPSKKGN